MSMQLMSGRTLDFNQYGNLSDFDAWDTALAEELAASEGLVLTEAHWTLIHFLRDYYHFHEIPPSPRVIIKAIGPMLSPHVPCTRGHLMALFPNGGCKQACRIAGLPRYYCVSC